MSTQVINVILYASPTIPNWIYERADKVIRKCKEWGRVGYKGEEYQLRNAHHVRGLAPKRIIYTPEALTAITEEDMLYLHRYHPTVEYWLDYSSIQQYYLTK